MSMFRDHLVRVELMKPPFLHDSDQAIVVVSYRVPGSKHDNVNWDTTVFRALRRSIRTFRAELPGRVKGALK